jgi:sugar transferase (PEP-CTERM/EpsH1 system associated)
MIAPVTVGHTLYAFKEGGMERGLLNIINYGNSERFRHVILCLTEAGAFADLLRSPSCEVVELRKKPGNDFQIPKRIATEVRRRHIDVLHARGWAALVETAVASCLSRVRGAIYGFHGKTLEDIHGISLKRRLLQKFFIRFYHRVVTLNSCMRIDFASESGLPEQKIRIIANGVDTELFRPRDDQHSLRAAFAVPLDRFVIGNVARLDAVKNHQVIFQALHQLRMQMPRPFFLLVGDGPHRATLESEIAALGLADDVRLYGYSNAIPELLNCMDVYVQSSFYEGFSNTVLEAMSCGLPILATDTGGTKDLFRENEEGYFFHPEDPEALGALILRLYTDNVLRSDLGRKARLQAVSEFSVQTMVWNYESLYTELSRCPCSRSLAGQGKFLA